MTGRPQVVGEDLSSYLLLYGAGIAMVMLLTFKNFGKIKGRPLQNYIRNHLKFGSYHLLLLKNGKKYGREN